MDQTQPSNTEISIKNNHLIKTEKFINEVDERFRTLESKLESFQNCFIRIKFIEEEFDGLKKFKTDFIQKFQSIENENKSLLNQLNQTIRKYDKIYMENLFIPGIIGDSTCRYTSYKDFLEEYLINFKDLVSFKDKAQIELKFLSSRLESLIKSNANSSSEFESRFREFIRQAIESNNLNLKSDNEFLLNRINELRTENSKYCVDLISMTKELKNASEKQKEDSEFIYLLHDKIKADIDTHSKNNENYKNDLIQECNLINSEFTKIKHSFDEIANFIKDVRFKRNLKDIGIDGLKQLSKNITLGENNEKKKIKFKTTKNLLTINFAQKNENHFVSNHNKSESPEKIHLNLDTNEKNIQRRTKKSITSRIMIPGINAFRRNSRNRNFLNNKNSVKLDKNFNISHDDFDQKDDRIRSSLSPNLKKKSYFDVKNKFNHSHIIEDEHEDQLSPIRVVFEDSQESPLPRLKLNNEYDDKKIMFDDLKSDFLKKIDFNDQSGFLENDRVENIPVFDSHNKIDEIIVPKINDFESKINNKFNEGVSIINNRIKVLEDGFLNLLEQKQQLNNQLIEKESNYLNLKNNISEIVETKLNMNQSLNTDFNNKIENQVKELELKIKSLTESIEQNLKLICGEINNNLTLNNNISYFNNNETLRKTNLNNNNSIESVVNHKKKDSNPLNFDKVIGNFDSETINITKSANKRNYSKRNKLVCIEKKLFDFPKPTMIQTHRYQNSTGVNLSQTKIQLTERKVNEIFDRLSNLNVKKVKFEKTQSNFTNSLKNYLKTWDNYETNKIIKVKSMASYKDENI